MRLFRARAVCVAYISFPRGAHPRGAFYVIGISYHIKKNPASRILFYVISYSSIYGSQAIRAPAPVHLSAG